MFLVSLLTLAGVWAIYWFFVVTMVSCVEAVGLTVAGLSHGPSVIDLFFLAFAAAATIWFFDLVRQHKRRQSYVRKGVEALLIAAGLLTVGTMSEMARPTAPGGAAPGWVYENIINRIPLFYRIDYVMLIDPEDDEYVTQDGRTWHDAFQHDAPGVDDEDFPLDIFHRPASRCHCWSRREESHRRNNFRLDWLVAEGMITEEEAAAERAERRIGPSPVEEDWCPAVRDLARTGWTGRP